MLSMYPACFFKEESGYAVVFPDLNYLSTCGGTFEESMEMAIDCLAGYLYTCQMDGDVIPSPSDLSQITPADIAIELGVKPSESFVNVVSVDLVSYAKEHFEKSVKKTLSIPEWLNRAALEKGVNFSQVLQDALKEQLNIARTK